MSESSERQPTTSQRRLPQDKASSVDNTAAHASQANKSTLIQLHVTDDSKQKTKNGAKSRETARRGTWPHPRKERVPGTYKFDHAPSLRSTPWELERSKRQGQPRGSICRRGTSQKFNQLPSEVVLRIVAWLQCLHSHSWKLDVASYQDDLRALCVCTQAWRKFGQECLYRELWLPDNESPTKSLMALKRPLGRLKKLLRTLESSRDKCDSVRTLRITTELANELENEAELVRGSRKDSSLRILEDIIRRCSNLEHITGYAPFACEVHGKLWKAVASCGRTRSLAWRLPHLDLGIPALDVLDCHENAAWNQLETLTIWQPTNARFLAPGSISAILQRLPALQNLVLVGLAPNDFHNGTLLSLPALKSLRLEELHGLTDQGIDRLSNTPLTMSLEKLALVGLELTSLKCLQNVFSSLMRLLCFSLVQDTSPEIPPLLPMTKSGFLLQSPTLQYLHWDVLAPGSAIGILANSIAAGKFPSLRTVKVPSDSDGLIQTLCQPIAVRTVTTRNMEVLEEWEQLSTYQRSLQVSQIQAQLRVRRQRQQPAMKLIVQDENDTTQRTHVIGSYLGDTISSIRYSLEPTIEGTASAIARIEDVLTPNKTELAQHLRKGEEPVLDMNILF